MMAQSHQLRAEIEEFLYREAELLDSGRFQEWLDLLAEDILYQMPVRMTRERAQGGDLSEEMQFFWDDKATLTLRVERLRTEFAWAEDPPSRTRHFVSNVRVRPTANPDEFDARSYILIYRTRGDVARHDLLSGERRDLLRRAGGAWKLAKRSFVVDQTVLGTRNLAIFV
jgi:3-phenylpropionate/cinnamic acid dioxygenase small subunit